MSELLDKQVNAQKEKNFQGSYKLPQAHEKVCDENETNKKKRRARKNFFNGREWFISRTRGTGETDRYEMLIDDS